ncbi:MAG: class I SAM-dependent methyltransferase [Acinetobacter sp.]|uniref:class I SAM-dependent methyltransferase n=1 Tax=Acinetobacter sp. TaxID=472 RepID=UPI000FBD6F23|nr:class I SAM-dependent methyltransferase [Acinetobacter sp.]RUP40651.1 MAG: class I SAM-dependent methyltransferase [Acinetobacter sp.]
MRLVKTRQRILKKADITDNLRVDVYKFIEASYNLSGKEFTVRNKSATDVVQEQIVRVAKYLPKNSTVIDIGCGAGIYSAFLGILGHKVVGIDISSTQLASAKQNNHLETVKFVRANILNVPFAPRSIDFFFVNSMFHYIMKVDRVLFLMQLKKALSSHGRILLITRIHPESYEAFVTDDKLGRETKRYVARSSQEELEEVFNATGLYWELIYTQPHEVTNGGVFVNYLLMHKGEGV